MSIKKILIAAAFSLPWLPFILIPAETLNQDISLHDMLLATPFILEFFSFYTLHGLTEHRGGIYTKSQQKYLLILVVCLFGLFSAPILIVALTGEDTPAFKITIVLGLMYALANLIINTRQIRDSSAKIRTYFGRRYIIPFMVAVGLYVSLLLTTDLSVAFNILAVYYIAKNFIYACTPESA